MKNNNFNALRLILAIMVILSHSYELIDGSRVREPLIYVFGTLTFGEISVDGFFLLSGFLITKSWSSNPSLLIYFRNRILRIYPGYIVCSLLCLFILAPLGANLKTYYGNINYWNAFYNLLTLGGPVTPPFVFDKPDRSINGSLWSIAPEFRCYIYVSIFGLLNIYNKKIWWLMATVLLILIFLSMQVVNIYHLRPAIFGRFPFNNYGNYLGVRLAMCFFAGGLYYFYADKISFSKTKFIVSAALLAIGLNFQLIAEIFYVVYGGYVLFYLAGLDFKFSNVLRKIPDVSFGVYLYAWPIQIILIWQFGITSGTWLFIFATLVSLFAGWLSWIFVEKPFLKLKRNSQLAV